MIMLVPTWDRFDMQKRKPQVDTITIPATVGLHKLSSKLDTLDIPTMTVKNISSKRVVFLYFIFDF